LISFEPDVYSALEQASNEKKLKKESIVSDVVLGFLQKEGYLKTDNQKQMMGSAECK